MLLLSADARRAIATVLARDRGALVALESAAALHLGRAPSLPVAIATERRESTGAVQCFARLQRASVACEGLRVASLEATIVELCTRPSAPLAVIAAAELLRVESAIERRRFDERTLARVVRRTGTDAARRRIAFLLSRAGRDAPAAEILPKERAGAVKLDPLGPPGGPVDGRFRVIVGVADGFAGLPDAMTKQLVDLVRTELGPVADEIAALVGLGSPLTVNARRAAAIARAEARGFLVPDAGGPRARAPFDHVCARIAEDVSARRMRSIVDTLARDSEPSSKVDAALLDPNASQLLLDPAIARTVDASRAAAVVRVLGPHLASSVLRPFVERIGRWSEAATLVRDELAEAPRSARVPLLLASAHVAWRRARKREAERCLDEVERALSRKADPRSSIEALLLRATLSTESGAHGRARRLLSEAMRVAEAAGRDHDRARALHRLGTIAARRGRPDEASAAYRAALEALGPKTSDTRALYGILESNLAATAAWHGLWDEAEDLARAALEDKRVAGTLAEVVSTRVLLSRIARARAATVPPGGRFAPLIDDVERAADPRLRVEAFLDLAEELAREGDVAAAARAVERAKSALFAVDRSEPVLDALVAHVDGLVEGLSGDHGAGLARIDRAARTFDRLRGAFWAARARRDAASLCDAAGRGSEALARLAAVEATCREHRFVLGEDPTHVGVYALAALEGRGHVRRFAMRALESVGPTVARTRLLAMGERARADALRANEAARTFDARERARLLRGVEDAIVLDERGPTLVLPGGVQVPLGRRRMLVPLFRALATHDEPIPLDQLARTVWDRRDASARAAVKMSISRLRDLLGPFGDDLVAVRVKGELAYGFRKPVPLVRLTNG